MHYFLIILSVHTGGEMDVWILESKDIMKYEQDIIRLLYEAGDDGLSVKKMVMHVYNLHNGLFEKVSYQVIQKDIIAYIKRNNKSKNGLLEKTGRRGYYRLSSNMYNSLQLMLDFSDYEESDKGEDKKDIDRSLSLF